MMRERNTSLLPHNGKKRPNTTRHMSISRKRGETIEQRYYATPIVENSYEGDDSANRTFFGLVTSDLYGTNRGGDTNRMNTSHVSMKDFGARQKGVKRRKSFDELEPRIIQTRAHPSRGRVYDSLDHE